MRRRPLCLVCLILMLCMCLADLAGAPLIRGNPLPDKVQDYIEEHPEAVICGEVQQCQAAEFSFSVYLKHASLIVRSEKISIENVRVFLKSEKELPAGTIVYVSGKLERVAAPRNPGEFDSRQYYACQHIYYFLKNGVVERRSRGYSGYGQFLLDLKERIREILENAAGTDAPVFEAMLLGEKSGLEQELKLRYQMGGMAHLIAISGLHVSILGMGLFGLLKKLGLGNGGAGLVSLAVMLQYGMLTGGSVSAMRAVCMFVIAVGAKILGRSYDLLTALALSAILLLLDSPAYLYSSSFLLSFGAVVGIGAVSSVLTELLGVGTIRGRQPESCKGQTAIGKIKRKGAEWRQTAVKAFAASLAVQLTTLPVVLTFFGEVSLAGILLNLAVLPTVGAVLVCGAACTAVGFFSIPAASAIVLPGRALLGIYEKACEAAGTLPFCTWIGGKPELWQNAVYYACLAGALGLGVWGRRHGGVPGLKASGKGVQGERRREARSKRNRVRWGGIGRVAAAVCLCALCVGILALGIFTVSWQSRGDLRITCLDIGQGDGIVVEVPDSGTFIVDCGSSNKENIAQYQLLPYLKSRGISYVTAILVSHTDNDHISGIRDFLTFMTKNLTTIRAGTLILPEWQSPPEAYGELEILAKSAGMKVKTVSQGDVLYCGPRRNVRKISGGAQFRFLAPADGASGADVNEDAMVAELSYGFFKGLFTGDIGEKTEKKLLEEFSDVDFLKVAHHGSRYSTCQEFLDRTQPELAIISCSSTNTYGHPSPETTLRLKQASVRTEYTMKNGAITLLTDGRRIWIERFLPENAE